ncbi:MAG: hypothetical protein IPP17_15395 [Bacteroidetes bacterium]|nr:hypothetical protein [Bacteroidota bacterium]
MKTTLESDGKLGGMPRSAQENDVQPSQRPPNRCAVAMALIGLGECIHRQQDYRKIKPENQAQTAVGIRWKGNLLRFTGLLMFLFSSTLSTPRHADG